ncbi:low molecular weight protein arginine phosphatase [Miniphocaeibacter massiliensis]|uniref:low molecular weight protein arginine phosphatase n=1 Tax=Miniphocaeibacter massiliensis TaxID=2041841 RepID=UPI000C078B24|nr:low molecular weight protein arginine phosphatase [Miniphocaeibacter massiliensis]
MNILFVCTGNTCRSPMAEYLFNSYFKETAIHRAKSVGTGAHGDYPSKNSILVMSEDGIDITRHISKQIDKEDIEWADLILTMGYSHLELIRQYLPNDKTFMFYDYVDKEKIEIMDPYGSGLEVYRETKEEIKELIKKLLKIL